jgi:hypothetical protein
MPFLGQSVAKFNNLDKMELELLYNWIWWGAKIAGNFSIDNIVELRLVMEFKMLTLFIQDIKD